jgi:hypothetical protein
VHGRTTSLLQFGVASVAVCLAAITQFAQAASPDKLLEKADRLAWLTNWPEARPLFAQAERFYASLEFCTFTPPLSPIPERVGEFFAYVHPERDQ